MRNEFKAGCENEREYNHDHAIRLIRYELKRFIKRTKSEDITENEITYTYDRVLSFISAYNLLFVISFKEYERYSNIAYKIYDRYLFKA